MKKLIAIILSTLLVLALASCGSAPQNDNADNNTATDPAATGETPESEAAPADETVAPASSLNTDGTMLGVLQTVKEQNDLRIKGLIIASGSGHTEYPSLEQLVEAGFKTESLCDTFFVNEWIEIYGDIEGGASTGVYVLPNDPNAVYADMKTSDLAAASEALDYPVFADTVIPDAENHGMLCSFYVHPELGDGLYNVFFTEGENICYMVQLKTLPTEQ